MWIVRKFYGIGLCCCAWYYYCSFRPWEVSINTMMRCALSSNIKLEIREIIQTTSKYRIHFQKNLFGPSQHPCEPSLAADHPLTRGIFNGYHSFILPILLWRLVIEIVIWTTTLNYEMHYVFSLGVEPVWCTKKPPSPPFHTHRGWIKGHNTICLPPERKNIASWST